MIVGFVAVIAVANLLGHVAHVTIGPVGIGFGWVIPVLIVLALVLAVVGLFAVGFYAARNTDRNPISKGLEIVAFGIVVFVVSYLAGHYIPPLFGHAPVSVGG